MVTKKEIDKELKMALEEIGLIKPWFDRELNAWVFEHSLYPIGYSGKTAKEVIQNYPLHLREFIIERLKNNLDPLVEKQVKGRGGAREGAGRPIGSIKEPTKQIRVPLDIAKWLKTPGVMQQVRSVMKAYKSI